MTAGVRSLGIAVLVAGLIACGSSVPPQPVGTAPAPTLRLSFAQPNSGCPLAALPAQSTFRIDPAALDPVVAVTADGRLLHIFWAQGFRGGTLAEPVVRDPAGQVVARDGEVVVDLDRGLHGYMVCSGSDALWVLLERSA